MDPDIPHYFYAINLLAQAGLLLTLAIVLWTGELPMKISVAAIALNARTSAAR
jgi:hypothetical protein